MHYIGLQPLCQGGDIVTLSVLASVVCNAAAHIELNDNERMPACEVM